MKPANVVQSTEPGSKFRRVVPLKESEVDDGKRVVHLAECAEAKVDATSGNGRTERGTAIIHIPASGHVIAEPNECFRLSVPTHDRNGMPSSVIVILAPRRFATLFQRAWHPAAFASGFAGAGVACLIVWIAYVVFTRPAVPSATVVSVDGDATDYHGIGNSKEPIAVAQPKMSIGELPPSPADSALDHRFAVRDASVPPVKLTPVSTVRFQLPAPSTTLTANERILTSKPGGQYALDPRDSLILVTVPPPENFGGYIDAKFLGPYGTYHWKVGDHVRCRRNNLIRFVDTRVVAGQVPDDVVGTIVDVEHGAGRKVMVDFPLQPPLSRLLFDPWNLFAADSTRPHPGNYHAMIIRGNAPIYNLDGRCIATLKLGTPVDVPQSQTDAIQVSSANRTGRSAAGTE